MISSMGRLMSFHHNRCEIRSVKDKNGEYLTCPLHGNGKRVTARIHRLVAEAFIGNIPSGYEVHHIDGNRQNNKLSNLEILSKKEHTAKTMAQNPNCCDGMNRYNKYIKPKKVKQYTQDGRFVAEYANCADASRSTGVCHRNILQVASRTEFKAGKTRKQAGGYVWVFCNEEREA